MVMCPCSEGCLACFIQMGQPSYSILPPFYTIEYPEITLTSIARLLRHVYVEYRYNHAMECEVNIKFVFKYL